MSDDTPLLQAVRQSLVMHEGWRCWAYDDANGKQITPGVKHLGNVTIGVGFNLDQPGARQICERFGIDYDAVHSGAAPMTAEQINAVLNYFIIGTMEWLTGLFPDFSAFTVPRQSALIDMGFNLGEGTFKQFHGMIGAISSNCWATAAEHALNSLWAKQVGKRAHDIADMLVNG